MYSLKVSLILCFLITGAAIAIERVQVSKYHKNKLLLLGIIISALQIINDASLQFNRIDDDVINTLEDDVSYFVFAHKMINDCMGFVV